MSPAKPYEQASAQASSSSSSRPYLLAAIALSRRRKSVEEQPQAQIVQAFEEPGVAVRSADVLGRPAPDAANAHRVRPPRIGRLAGLVPYLVLSEVAEVVLVEDLLAQPQRQVRQRHLAQVVPVLDVVPLAGPFGAIATPVRLEGVQVVVLPA